MEPDLLVSLDPMLHLVTLSAGRLSGVPVQWHSHDAAPPRMQGMLDTLAPWTAGILAPSQTLASTYNMRAVGRYMKLVRPSLLLDAAPLAQRSAVRQGLRILDDAPLLAALGRISETSGHMDALNALNALILLRKTMPNLRLVLLEEVLPSAAVEGDAPDTSAVSLSVTASGGDVLTHLRDEIAKNGLEDAMMLLGPCTDALDILAVSDIVIFPQERVAGSRDLLLALASGTPLVATRICTHAELLANAWDLLLVKPKDPKDLALSVMGVLQQQELYGASAHRNPSLVRDVFPPQVESGRLVRIYSNICQPEGQTLRLPTRQEVAPLQRHWVTALLKPKA